MLSTVVLCGFAYVFYNIHFLPFIYQKKKRRSSVLIYALMAATSKRQFSDILYYRWKSVVIQKIFPKINV